MKKVLFITSFLVLLFSFPVYATESMVGSEHVEEEPPKDKEPSQGEEPSKDKEPSKDEKPSKDEEPSNDEEPSKDETSSAETDSEPMESESVAESKTLAESDSKAESSEGIENEEIIQEYNSENRQTVDIPAEPLERLVVLMEFLCMSSVILIILSSLIIGAHLSHAVARWFLR